MYDSMIYDYTSSSASVSPVVSFFYFAFLVFYVVSMAFIFKKAGKASWAAIIPIKK